MLDSPDAATTPDSAPIPEQLHYIWFGSTLPYFAKLAMRSALVHCSRAKVVLWLGHDVPPLTECAELHGTGRFEVRHFELTAELERIVSLTGMQHNALTALWGRLSQRAAQANVARLAILAAHGGIYLDTDTLLFRDLRPLGGVTAFCGLEPVIWPFERKREMGAYRLLGGPTLGLVRDAMAYFPKGYRLQRHVAPFFSLAANNAVVGMQAGHSLALDAFDRITHMPDEELLRRYRLGTHLLQELIASGEHDILCHPPERFYPLGPVMSRHFFRERADAANVARELIAGGTYAVHWYASVSDLAPLDETWLRRQGQRTVFGQLCLPLLG